MESKDFFRIGSLVLYGAELGVVEGKEGRRYRVLLATGERVLAPAGDIALPGEDIAYRAKEKAVLSANPLPPTRAWLNESARGDNVPQFGGFTIPAPNAE